MFKTRIEIEMLKHHLTRRLLHKKNRKRHMLPHCLLRSQGPTDAINYIRWAIQIEMSMTNSTFDEACKTVMANLSGIHTGRVDVTYYDRFFQKKV